MPIQTWDGWNTTTSTLTNCTNSTVWCDWNALQISTATATTNQVWFTWAGTGGTNQLNTQFTGANRAQQAALSPEQVEEYAERQRQYAALAEKEHKARLEAEARAEKLLLENLSLKQRAEYEKDKHFVVERGDRRYRIRRGRSGNVDVIDKGGRITHRLCAHPAEGVPDPDTMLAQKLMLEHDDDHFMRIANRHEAHDRQTAVLPAMQ